DRSVLARWNQLGADISLEHIAQDCGGGCIETAFIGGPSNQILDQRFRYARIDAIVRHVIADAVSAPAQREFAEIARAHYETAMHIGDAKEVTRPLARLHVLECNVMNRFAASERVPEVLKHL